MVAAPAVRSIQAPAPERPIAKGMASPGLLAHVLVSKYCDHTPLYRQAQIFARHGVEIDRSTLANWVGGACWWLEPLQSVWPRMCLDRAKSLPTNPDPGARPWPRPDQDGPIMGLYARRSALERPDPPAAVYFYSPDRKAERPASHLEGSGAFCRSTVTLASSG